MQWQRLVIYISAVALLLAAFLGRYEIVGIGIDDSITGGAYRLDRWTGRVVFVKGIQAIDVKMK